MIRNRFQQLRTVLTNTNCSYLLELTNDALNTGAYAWIMCRNRALDCYKVLQMANLIGTGGEGFGVTNQGTYAVVNALRARAMGPVQCNLDYPNPVYPGPHLSEHSQA